MNAELGESQREMRNYHCETVRLRSFHEEINEQFDLVKRENKNLADEIKDLLEQVNIISFELMVMPKQNSDYNDYTYSIATNANINDLA